MNSLPQEEIDVLTSTSSRSIIACGVHPQDKSLMLITNEANVLTIKPNGRMKPLDAWPIDGGRQIKIVFNNPYGLHILDSQVVISVAKDELSEKTVMINGKEMMKIQTEHET